MVWYGGLGHWVHEDLGGWYEPVVEKDCRSHIMLGLWMWMLGKLRFWKFSSRFILVWGIIPTQEPSRRCKNTGIYPGPMKARHTSAGPAGSVFWKIFNRQFLLSKSVPCISCLQRYLMPWRSITTTLLFCFLRFFFLLSSRGKIITSKCTVI